jgi:hypothetical protein
VNGATIEPDDAVQRYLDDLFTSLRGRPRACRRLLAETEAHLLDALDAGVAEGLSHDDAAERAVAQFGPPTTLIGAGLPVTAAVTRMLRPLLLAGAGLAAAGMLAVGASGVIAGLFRATLGDRFVSGDLPGVSYTAARCADFFEYAPSARTCLDAAASHHADEVVINRVAIGVLGLIALAAYLMMRRRWGGIVRADGSLPAGFAPGIGTALFGLAAAVLSLASFSALLVGRIDGGGQYLSAALVATAAAVASAVCWLRAVVRPITVAEPGPERQSLP